MGIGDEIMAAAQAKALHLSNGLPVYIVDRFGRVRQHEMWLGNPRITARLVGAQRLVNGAGVRPYIAAKTNDRWTWKKWPIEPGEIYLTEDEKRFGSQHSGRILIEPHTKVPDSNKAWPWERWQAVVDRFPHRFIQVGAVNARRLRGVENVVTTFREACSVLASSKAFVGPEGALHHAAAALGVPAVVLWSEYIDPAITGYESQRNIRHAGAACGSRVPCDGCRASMAAITVDEVLTGLAEIV